MSFGKHAHRYLGGVKQAEIAQLLGVTPPTVSRWFGDDDAEPSLAQAAVIADRLGVPIDYLVGRASPPSEAEEVSLAAYIKQLGPAEVLRLVTTGIAREKRTSERMDDQLVGELAVRHNKQPKRRTGDGG